MVPTARLIGFFDHLGHNELKPFTGWIEIPSMKYIYLVGTKVAICLGTITKADISN